MTQILTIDHKRYYLLDEVEYGRLRRSRLPELPGKDETGGIPAVEYVRALIARRIVEARQSLGWSQAELARRAGIRAETLNRVEKCKHSADPNTIEKIDAAIGRERKK